MSLIASGLELSFHLSNLKGKAVFFEKRAKKKPDLNRALEF
jgi:hypothetical protein